MPDTTNYGQEHDRDFAYARRWTMGRDKVLGLSLAILLIGFAAAFCFRNEQFVESGMKLARAKLLDQAIAEKPGPKPYASDPKIDLGQPNPRTSPSAVTLQGIETIDASGAQKIADARPATDSSSPAKSSPPDSAADPIPGEDFVTTERSANSTIEKSEIADFPRASIATKTIKPSVPVTVTVRPNMNIRPQTSARKVRAVTAKPQNVAWRNDAKTESNTDGSESGDKTSNVRSTDDGDSPPLVHRVQRGDTLMRLAHRYLGDGGRYREIYEANRDQLRGPDDRLQIGMTLRIPRDTAKPAPARSGPVAARKTPTKTTNVANKSSRTRKATVRNVSRVRETPPARTEQETPNATGMEHIPAASPKDRFTPVRKSPFLPRDQDIDATEPSAKRKLSQTPPDGLPEMESPDTSYYQFFPKGDHPIVTARRPGPTVVAAQQTDVILR